MLSLWNYLIDIIYVAVAVTVIAIFTKRGFIESLFRSGRAIVAGLICYLVGPVVSDALYEGWIYDGIFSWVFERVETFLQNTVGAVNVDGMIDSLPLLVRQLVDANTLREKFGVTDGDVQEMAAEFSETAAKPLASLLSNLLAYVLVFLAAMLLLLILFKILDAIFKMPILNAINHTLGFILGASAAFLLLAVVTYLAGLVAGVFGSTDILNGLREMSFCFRWFDDLSIFSLF